MSKRIIAFLMAAAMALSMAACGTQTKTETETPSTTTPSTQTSAPAATTPATTTPAETPVEKTVAEMTKEERIEAMKNEPMYDETVVYWYGGGNCTSAPYVAQELGLYEEYGIKAEILSGAAIKESLGTNAAQIGVSHIASLLVPITNGVNYTFVAGAHVGCQSLFVLADSPYYTTADLVGKKISVPNGIGNSSYNITARWLDADGIDPLKDVEMIQVETDACVASMESGEIAAVCTGDTWGYNMVKEGKLRVIRSLIDEDFVTEPCCVVAMNNDFIEENPVMAAVMTECIKKASNWMRENPEEAVQMLLDVNQLSGPFEKNLELWNTLQFGLTDEVTGAALEKIIDDYMRLGLIPEGGKNAEEMLEAAWTPLASYADNETVETEIAAEGNDEVSLTVSALSAEEIEAMKSEPQFEKGLTYLYGSGNCTSAPYVAQKLGLFDQYGIKAEQLKGVSTLEALGSNQAQVNINHIATMLVPCTNGVNYTFVAGAHIGCQSLFVLADSEYYTTEDLRGKAISAPNGIGNSSYNIMSRMFDHDGMNPLTDIEITVVDTDACIVAMENGEIAGMVTGDTWAYDMVKEGKLRVVRSLQDEDFAQEPCCVVVMNNDFIRDNPNMAKAVTECIKIAGDWMRQNPEEAVQMLMDDNLLSGEMSKHVELWNSLQFGPSDAMAEAALKTIIDDYIRLDLLTATDDAAEVLAKAWNPLLPDSNLGYDVNENDGSWWD